MKKLDCPCEKCIAWRAVHAKGELERLEIAAAPSYQKQIKRLLELGPPNADKWHVKGAPLVRSGEEHEKFLEDVRALKRAGEERRKSEARGDDPRGNTRNLSYGERLILKTAAKRYGFWSV